MPKYKLFFADLHFHTRYSDNRDRATIEEMILAGVKHELTIFGVGDHNHNFDLKKWKEQKQESNRLRKKYPSYMILSNCEVTFLLGHFLIIEPEVITGTVREGYELLYKNKEYLKILNHPDPANDEWHSRFIPNVAGIEVINGSLFRKALKAGYHYKTALDISFIRLFARYLAMGCPVAAIGSSDAHELVEMGLGMTGIWLPYSPTAADVNRAIRTRNTFATTDPGIRIQHHLKNGQYSWEVEWYPLNPAVGRGFMVELYRGYRKLPCTDSKGCINAGEKGFYWIAAFNDRAIAVSSPLYPDRECPDGPLPVLDKQVHIPMDKSLEDLIWLNLNEQPSLDLSPRTEEGIVEIDLLSEKKIPELIDANGTAVEYELIHPGAERIVIDKQCSVPCFDEFFLWLERNEIHEYMFIKIEYRKVKDLFTFNGLLVPAKMVLNEKFRNRYKNDLFVIKRVLTPETKFKLFVRTLYRARVRFNLKDHLIPLKVDQNKMDLHSLVLWNGRTSDQMIPPPFCRTAQVPGSKTEQRLFQVFI